MTATYDILDGLVVPTYLHDPSTGRVLYANPAGRDLLGLPDGASIDLVDGLMSGPRTSHERPHELARRAAAGDPQRALWRARRADGEVVWAELIVTSMQLQGQTVVMTTARDTSLELDANEALKQSERELERANRMFQLVLDTIPVRVFWKDRESRFLGCNRLFALDAGRSSPDDLIGEDDHAMSWSNEAELYRGDDRIVIETGCEKVNFEEPQTTPGGETIWLRTSKLPLRNRAGEVFGLLGTYEDITKERRDREALRASESSLRTTLDSIGEGVIVVDADGKVRQLNPIAEQLLRCEPGKAIGRRVTDVLFLRSLADDGHAIDPMALESGTEHEALSVNAQGEERRLASSWRPMRGDGVPGGAVLVLRDVTEAHQLQQHLLHAQKMEAIGQLASGVAHDFNNLLQAIIGYIDLCLLDDAVSGELEGNLRRAETAAQRATALTAQLLAFSRRSAIVRELVRPADLLGGVVELAQRLIRQPVDVVSDIAEGLPLINVDQAQLEVSLLNLCINARDAMREGGRLTIKARALGESSDSYRVRIEVIDTGVGIALEDQKRIFEPFFTTKTVGKGTGLGLPTARTVVERLGGSLTLNSRRGEGTVVAIELPAIAQPDERSATTDGTDPAQRAWPGAADGARVLLAEDDELVRTLAQTILKRAGHVVTVAEDGEQAAQLFEAEPEAFDLAILDVEMPGRSGREVEALIGAARPSLPVLLCSGYPRPLEGTEGSSPHLIHKPYSARTLLERVETLLRTARFQGTKR